MERDLAPVTSDRCARDGGSKGWIRRVSTLQDCTEGLTARKSLKWLQNRRSYYACRRTRDGQLSVTEDRASLRVLKGHETEVEQTKKRTMRRAGIVSSGLLVHHRVLPGRLDLRRRQNGTVAKGMRISGSSVIPSIARPKIKCKNPNRTKGADETRRLRLAWIRVRYEQWIMFHLGSERLNSHRYQSRRQGM